MLNPNLDIAALRSEFETARHIRIRDVLQRGAARALAAEFPSLPWKLFAADGSGVRVIDPSELLNDAGKQRLVQTALMAAASKGEGFAYMGVQLKVAGRQLHTQGQLANLCATLRSPEMLALVRDITGNSEANDITAQASQFRPGHYLTRHTDDISREGRKFAFVLGLTEQWHPDWGGLLQFFQKEGDASHARTPGFNTLDLFDVSEVHSVTHIAPYALAPRLAVSGWFVKA